MKESTLFIQITQEQFEEHFNKLHRQIAEFSKKPHPKSSLEFYTKTEVAELFKCDPGTIRNWSIKGKLKPLLMGNRVYYSVGDIKAAMKLENEESE